MSGIITSPICLSCGKHPVRAKLCAECRDGRQQCARKYGEQAVRAVKRVATLRDELRDGITASDTRANHCGRLIEAAYDAVKYARMAASFALLPGRTIADPDDRHTYSNTRLDCAVWKLSAKLGVR